MNYGYGRSKPVYKFNGLRFHESEIWNLCRPYASNICRKSFVVEELKRLSDLFERIRAGDQLEEELDREIAWLELML
jgi:hypothetical protein